MFQNWVGQLFQVLELSQLQWLATFSIVGALWAIQAFNALVHYRLNLLGIWPRQVYGLPGILLSPLLHGGFDHLFFNSIPLLILTNLLLIYGVKFYIGITLFIALISGFATWLFARPGIHVGASSVIMGYWGFFLAQVYFHPSIISIFVGVLCIYYLGGLWLNLLPSGKGVSWEGHVFGCLAGIAAAFMLQFFPM